MSEGMREDARRADGMGMAKAPIAVFDSGLGGLSVVRAIRRMLPAEDVLYFGDSANAPYGTRTVEEVRRLSVAICDRFAAAGAKAIVVACNTATSACVNDLRARYDMPIIGMEPALKVACDRGLRPDGSVVPQHVVVCATPLTLRERKFAMLMDRFDTVHDIRKQPCPELVRIVEEGRRDDERLVMDTLHGYLDAYDLDRIDSVVLGCTHFVFYREYFRRLLPDSVAIIDGNEGTVRHLADVLARRDELAAPLGAAPAGAGVPAGVVTVGNSDPSARVAALSHRLLGE